MENDIKSKRKEKRGGETIDKSKETIEKYQNINYSSLTLDDCEKVRKYYIHRLDEINKLKENNEVKELVDLAESFIKKIIALETESFSLESKHKSLQTETNNIQKTTSEINRKINDKEKYSKLIIEKINVINADKQKIISEESEKRNVVVKETENFVRTLQSKYEEELPEKKKLIEENQLLRSEIEQCIKNSGNLKDLLESQLKEKEKASEDIENKIKNDLKSKMENMSFHAQKYIFENSELKIQIANYKKKNEELSSLVDAFNKEYDKLKNELEKKKQDIILLSAENYDLQMKFKPKYGNKEALEQAYQQHEKTISQFNAMKKLNKKLNEQFENIKKEFEEKNLNINDFIEI